MSPEQEEHLLRIQQWFDRAVDAKYRKGQKEHGGNLWDRNPVVDMEGEVLDLVTYFFTLREKQNRIYQCIVYAREALSKGNMVSLEQCLDEIHKLTSI